MFWLHLPETPVVCYSVGNTEADDKNHTEFMRGGQPSNLQRCCPGLGRTDRGPLVSSVSSTSDVPSDTAFYFNEMSVTWTDGSKMITTTTEGMGQSNRVHVFTPGLSVSIDPPTILVDESEVSVVVDEGAFLDVSRHCFALQQEHAGF